jgi:hypothetical protein
MNKSPSEAYLAWAKKKADDLLELRTKMKREGYYKTEAKNLKDKEAFFFPLNPTCIWYVDFFFEKSDGFMAQTDNRMAGQSVSGNAIVCRFGEMPTPGLFSMEETWATKQE